MLSCLSGVRLYVMLWSVAFKIPLSMGFSGQEYWSGLPWPAPKELPDPGITPATLRSALAGGFFTTSTVNLP